MFSIPPKIKIGFQFQIFRGVARQYSSSFVIDGIGYVIGGIDCSSNFLNDCYAYNPETDSWQMKSNLPISGLASSVAFSDGNYGYVITGRNGLNFSSSVFRYNPISDEWTELNHFPGGERSEMAITKIGARVFLGCGVDENQSPYYDWWEYSFSNDTWNRRADFIGIQTWYILSMDNGIIGLGIDTAVNYFNTLYKYDPFNDKWNLFSEFPYDCRGATGFFLNGSWIVVGGLDENSQRLDKVYKWRFPDPELNSVKLLSVTNQTIEFYTDFATGNYFTDIYSITGQKIYSATFFGNENYIRIEIPVLSTGIYIYEIRSELEKISSGKFVAY